MISGDRCTTVAGTPPYVSTAMLLAVFVLGAVATFHAPPVRTVPRPAHRAGPTRPIAAVTITPRLQDKSAFVPPPSEFETEQRMSPGERMSRWYPQITRAAQRFNVPVAWMRSVLALESGGRTMSGPGIPITSSAGAMGLMQLMPDTYRDMRDQYRLGPDPYDPHDNIVAAAAYLRQLHDKYGYPAMFAAYNDGPGNLAQRMIDGRMLPLQTQLYVAAITGKRPLGIHGGPRNMTRLTRPDGVPVLVDAVAASSVRAPLPGEYAPSVRAVVTAGRVTQGVRESVASAKAALRAHGGGF